MKRLVIYLGFLIMLIMNVNGLKLLLVFPLPARSHYILGNELGKGLARLGHDVTLISAVEDKNPPNNYKEIVLDEFMQEKEAPENKLKFNMFEMESVSPYFQLIFLCSIGNRVSEEVFRHAKIQALLNSNQQFDAVIIEQFWNDAMKVFAYHFKAPLIAFSTIGPNRWVNNLIANPENPSYIPDLLLSFGDRMTFYERFYNFVFGLVSDLALYNYFYPSQNALLKKYFPGAPHLNELQYNVSLVLTNSHESINAAVPHVPNMIDIGGFHVNPPKELPKDLKDLMDNATEGVIYFSLGSNLQPSIMPKEKKDIILKVLGSRREKVLWKWDEDKLENKPSNVMISKWFPQQAILDEKREQHRLDVNIYKPSDYDRLALSLISPLPNEQDFAINVCTLLSNDNRHNLKLDKHPRILTYLLAHAGIFNHSSLRQLFVHIYGDIRKKPIHNFWNDVLESDEFLDLTNETNFYTLKEEAKPCDTLIKDDYLKYVGLDSVEGSNEKVSKNGDEFRDTDSECEIIEDSLKPPKYFKFKSDLADRELFCLRRTLGTQDYVGQRVLQIATILRNLCFIEDNVSVLTKNATFVRFLLLCSCSQWSTLKNLGLDMLGNVATEFELKDVQNDLIGASLLKIICKNLQSHDRTSCLSSVEVLNKLSQNEKNEDVLIRSLESTVYKKVCSFLTIHDVMLLIYTLECLYSLSSLGERSCNFIANNHGVIDTLVSLVTVEGKSYGPKACIGMKLVETIPSGNQLQAQAAQSPQQQSTQSPQQVSPQLTNSSTSVTVPSSIDNTPSAITSMASSPPAPSVTPVKVIPSVSSTPVRTMPLAPQRILATPLSPVVRTEINVVATPTKPMTPAAPIVTTTTPTVAAPPVMPSLTPQQLIQQQHAHQQAIQENEQFALAWLRATYEPSTSGNKVDHQELYKHYIGSCSKIGRRGVISPLHFPRCVRSVFGGTVGPNPMKPANLNDPQYYEGIKVRAQPLKLNIPPPSPPPKPILMPTPMPKSTVRRKQKVAALPIKSSTAVPLAVEAELEGTSHILSPASPILKAQLSAPPKPRESSCASSTLAAPSDSKSQRYLHKPALSADLYVL